MTIKLTASAIGGACVCLGLRRAARAVARRYDDAFRPLGITSGQFSILAALLGDKPVAMTELADRLGMDRTTLNRNLRPVEGDGLVETVTDEEDRRVRGLRLTSKGQRLLEKALPIWDEQQAETYRYLGEKGWSTLKPQLSRLR